MLLVLFSSGWATGHFTAMLPVLATSEGLSHVVVDAAFGIYVLGLLPGLLWGGRLSDRLGRRPLLLYGAAVAALGNLLLACWHDQWGISAGRLIIGVGVGVAMSTGTAWCADLGGASGAMLSGVALSAGFGCGPMVSAALSEWVEPAPAGAFAVAGALSALTMVVVLVAARAPATSRASPAASSAPGCDDRQESGRAALRTAVPMGMWVFACAAVAMVTMAELMQHRFNGPFLPAVASALAQAVAVAVQLGARRRGWGPRSGVVGAAAAAAGFGVVAAAGDTPTLSVFVIVTVLLGAAYGLCLRQGLIDIETLAPLRQRGTLAGIFYGVAYLGFGLPLLLAAIRPAAGIAGPMLVLAAGAAATALLRSVQLRRRQATPGVHAHNV